MAFILLDKISLSERTGTETSWDYNWIVLFLVIKVVASIECFFFKQECVFMGKTSSSVFGKWVATDCNSTHGFICSRDVGEFNWTLWICREIAGFYCSSYFASIVSFFHFQILVLPQCLLKFLKLCQSRQFIFQSDSRESNVEWGKPSLWGRGGSFGQHSGFDNTGLPWVAGL